MELIDFALPVGWIALGALGAWAAQRLVRDRATERLTTTIERHDASLDERLSAATASLETRLLAELGRREATFAAALESRLERISPSAPEPVEDDAAARLHARRRRVAPELFAAVRDLHRCTGDVVDTLHGWPAGVDPPDLWDGVDVARARMHALFARTRIHLPTPVDTRIAEYQRLVKECLKSRRVSEQLREVRPQAARFAEERAAELLRAADNAFQVIEDDLRSLIEDAGTATPATSGSATRPTPPDTAGDPEPGGIRPAQPKITFESDLLSEDDDPDTDADHGRATNGGPSDTLRPGD
jgi:hypothetical protein